MFNLSKLYFIAPDASWVKKACEVGINLIQLRIKNRDFNFVLAESYQAKAIASKYNATLIINDYPEIAKTVDADGVHLGKEDLSVIEAREILGANKIIGASTNSFDDIEAAYKNGANYVGLGPYRFTTTKEKLNPILGLTGYQEILKKVTAAQIKIPIYAIGGINTPDLSTLMPLGFHGIAVVTAITNASDLNATSNKFKELLYDQNRQVYF